MVRARKKSRRSEWEDMRNQLTGNMYKNKGFEGRENIHEKACGRCENFSENAFASDGRGFCGVLKQGSDFTKDSPVIITEGDTGLMVSFSMDATKCPHYKEMEFMDTDGTECADPKYRRAQRQMSKN